MTATRRDPYATFLGTADASIWRSCLDEAITRVDDPPPDVGRTQALTQALTIAMYVTWLNTNSGDPAAAEYGQQKYEQLAGRLSELPPDPGEPAGDTCWGLVLGWSRYGVHGLELLARHGRPALEHHLICLPGDDLQIVAALREDFAAAGGRKFLPAVHVYGSALVNVGALTQARALVTACGWPETEPLLAAVLGAAAERAGDWPEAHARYQASTWPEHRYRAALTGVIAGAGRQQLTLDQPLLDTLGVLETELNQTALIRSAAFLDACLWQPISNWLVELEQGKLCFGRRWHSEADTHFAAALAAAPEPARYPVGSLRFTNLTWLTGGDKNSAVDLEPEAHTAGREALALAPGGDDKGEQCIWLASRTGDRTLIPAEFGHWAAPQRAEAWAAQGNEVKAIDAHLASLEQAYGHRTVTALIRRLAPAGFSEARGYLAGLVLRESEDDFFSLWETTDELQPRSSTAVGEVRLDRTEDGADERFWARLRDLSLLEFKNAVRSIRLFRRAGRHDVAEELLVRAARSAESVSELVAVAVLCRPGDARGGKLTQLGYGCLMRAARESRDRFERLQIARELFSYGQIANGRAILEDEHVFSADTVLSHAEAVAVLQCSAWLSADRIEAVVATAVDRLRRDAHSGVLGADYALYVDRLGETLAQHDIQLVAQDLDLATAAPPENADEQGTDTWGATVDAIAESVQNDESGLTNDVPVDLKPGATFGERLAVAKHLLGLMSEAQAAARSAQPDAAPEAMPVRLDLTGDGVRTVQLGDLWRLRLTGNPAEQLRAEEQLRAFYAEEEELDARWEEEMREAARRPNRKLVRVCHLLSSCLDTLVRPEERSFPHPIVRGFYNALARDVERLSREVAEAAQTAMHGLAVTRQQTQGSGDGA